LPALDRRFWVALCLASIFGANTGDFIAHYLNLGHAGGLPFLVVAFALVLVAERFDRRAHEAWYWLAIVIVRTAATNLADFLTDDMNVPRRVDTVGLAVSLVVAVLSAWLWRRRSGKGSDRRSLVLGADAGYWASMLIAGTLGTVIGDYLAYDRHVGNAVGSIALSIVLAGFFLLGARGLIWRVPFYWATVVMVRAAGTCVGDFLAGRPMGLAVSTVVTGAVFVAMLLVWRSAQPQAVPAD
jgi:uncharacterized membrane-anchored protein